IPCVVIGKGRGYAEKVKIFITENKLENYFIFLENIANSELPEFYKNATAFIYPSLYEGFGIPILEAMASGCPVITSHMSSMPEVAGEAALYFYPYHAHLIAEKIIQVTEDSDLRNEMIKKGFLQSELFVAKKNTEQVMQIYKSLVVK
ncbi:MAG: glycosyltransferase family 4 protein, partial [Fimbriimonadaceae bacterium]|nr:glycosyltransferase family 4 protein [Chitinophagales bacterium]